ncbi:MAG: hypothetical protein LYZ66_05480 [Nitrososphaerales archaeon]|nr:hypothetical protein [Nitrososphaerales archaeon]
MSPKGDFFHDLTVKERAQLERIGVREALKKATLMLEIRHLKAETTNLESRTHHLKGDLRHLVEENSWLESRLAQSVKDNAWLERRTGFLESANDSLQKKGSPNP